MFSKQAKNSFKAIEIVNQVRFTAQSKKNRIEIQLLKNFPGIGVAGQIIKTKPSAMINKFHPNGGAVYLNYKGAEPKIPVVTKAAVNKAADALDASKKAKIEAKSLKNKQLANAAAKLTQKELKTLSLDEILNIDFNVLTESQLSLVFTHLPKNFVFVKNAEDKTLASPITVDDIKTHIQFTLSKSVRQSDVVLKFVNGKSTIIEFKNEDGSKLAENTITALGNYFVDISNGDKSAELQITVNSTK